MQLRSLWCVAIVVFVALVGMAHGSSVTYTDSQGGFAQSGGFLDGVNLVVPQWNPASNPVQILNSVTIEFDSSFDVTTFYSTFAPPAEANFFASGSARLSLPNSQVLLADAPFQSWIVPQFNGGAVSRS